MVTVLRETEVTAIPANGNGTSLAEDFFKPKVPRSYAVQHEDLWGRRVAIVPGDKAWLSEQGRSGRLLRLVGRAGVARMNRAVTALINAGVAEDAADALAQIDRGVLVPQYGRVRINVADLKGRSQIAAEKELARLVGGNGHNGTGHANLDRLHGTLSHRKIIPKALDPRGFLPDTPKSSTAGTLFDQNPSQAPLFMVMGEQWKNTSLKDQLQGIRECLLQMQVGFRGEGHQFRWFHDQGLFALDRMSQLLKPFWGEAIDELRKQGFAVADSHYWESLTLMTWAQITLFGSRRGEKRLMFRNKPVRIEDGKHLINFGEVDSVTIDAVGGRTPRLDRKNRAIVEELQLRGLTTSELALELEGRFGDGPISPTIEDWKCWVGDGPRGGAVIKRDEGGEITDYDDQVRRYLIGSTIPYLQKKGIELDGHMWDHSPFSRGRVVIFSPFAHPGSPAMVREVSMTPPEGEEFLFNHIVSRWPHLVDRALTRQDRIRVSRFAVNALQGRQRFERPVQLSLIGWDFLDDHRRDFRTNDQEEGAVARLVEGRRRFLDGKRIVEVAGLNRRGLPKYELHLDRLLEAINAGEVVVDPATLEGRTMHVRCLNPEHDDHDPSFQVTPEKGLAKCFSCGIAASISPFSIPESLDLDLSTIFATSSLSSRLRDLVIPEEHAEFMAAAQEIFQLRFWDGGGGNYLLMNRSLDPWFAHGLGVGFCDEEAIHLLLDRYSLEDLRRYGVVRDSVTRDPEQGLMSLLLGRGLRPSDIVTKKKTKAGERDAYPFSELDYMVTFPLSIGGKITSFAGRDATGEKSRKFAHRKLSTGVRHGVFNEAALHSASDLVLPTESGMEALSLGLLRGGTEDVVGIIGTDNELIWEMIALSGKSRIGMALNYDTEARKKVWGDPDDPKKKGRTAVEKLRAYDFTGEVFDYTDQVIEINPWLLDDVILSGLEVGKRPKDWNDILRIVEDRKFNLRHRNLAITMP